MEFKVSLLFLCYSSDHSKTRYLEFNNDPLHVVEIRTKISFMRRNLWVCGPLFGVKKSFTDLTKDPINYCTLISAHPVCYSWKNYLLFWEKEISLWCSFHYSVNFSHIKRLLKKKLLGIKIIYRQSLQRCAFLTWTI